MRRVNQLCGAMTLLLFFFLTTVSAQTVTLKGLVVNEFPVKEGKIKVYLPDDIRPGDVITGTVVAEPAGKNEKEKSRNDELLQKYKVNAGVVITHVSSQSQPVKLTIAEFKPVFITLSDDKTAEITNFPVPLINIISPQPTAINIPTHALTGSPLRIIGSFDGDASNTKCRIDGKEMKIIAESPRQTVVAMPQAPSGPHTITVEENGRITEKKISAVNLDMTADKTNLRTGQKAIITTSISGLQNLPGSVTLFITNASTGTVNLIGGNTQTITINPSQVNSSGSYTQTFTVQSISTGNYTLNADLDLPEPATTSSPVPVSWVACNVGNQVVMLPASACEEIKKKMNTGATSSTLPTVPETNPISTGWSLQTIRTSGKQKLLKLFYANTFSPAMFRVDYRELGYTDRYPILSSDHIPGSTTKDSNWTIPFTPPSANSVYSVQFTAYGGDDYQQSKHTLFYTTTFYKPEIRNREIDSIRGVINALDGEISRREQEKTDKGQQITNASSHADEDVKKRNDEYTLARELETIDLTLSGTWSSWTDSLYKLVDSLEGFLGREGQLPEWELLGQKQRDAERASNGCENAMNNLLKEKEDLEKEISDLDKQYQQTIDDMKKLVEKNHPYLRFKATTYKDKSGGLHTIVDLYLQSAGNQETITSYGPSDIPDIKEAYNTLQAKLKAAAAKQNADRKRLAEIPGEIEKLKAECERKKKELDKSNKERESGVAKIRKDEWLRADINNLCGRIRAALEDLVDWCKKHKGMCNDDYQERASQLDQKCPHTKAEFEQFRNMFNNIISSKEAMEKIHHDNGDYWKWQVEDDNKKTKQMQDELDGIQQKIDDAGGELAYARHEEQNAVDREVYRRNAEKARQDKAERDANAERKRICGEYLKSQMKTEAQQQWLNTIINIKTAMLEMGEEVEQATKAMQYLPKDKRLAALTAFAQQFASKIGALLEPLKKFEELKGKIEGLLKNLSDLQSFLSGNHSPEDNAKNFGKFLGYVDDGLSAISTEFPILGFFSAYFSFLVQGYNAAVDGAYKAFSDRHDVIIESSLKNFDCIGLIQEYQKTKDINKLAEWVFNKLNFGIITPRSNEERRILMVELQKGLLKKMTDCCMYWIMVPG